MNQILITTVMEWWSIEGQNTGSRQFSAHPKSSLAHIDKIKRMARATRNTHYYYNQISPLDHKMADNCVFLARTNTVFSTITKLIKTSNDK